MATYGDIFGIKFRCTRDCCKYFFSNRVINKWNQQLEQQVVGASSINAYKGWVHMQYKSNDNIEAHPCGATENAGVENAIRAKWQGWKMHEWKMQEWKKQEYSR